ncbi:hypothetical protein CR513_18755, partial [Mucuna pruriens]
MLTKLIRVRNKRVFEESDLVWVHLRKKLFPNLRKSMQLPRGVGPFKLLTKRSDNAYILEMPQTYGSSNQESNLREISFQEGESNVMLITLEEEPQARKKEKENMESKAL